MALYHSFKSHRMVLVVPSDVVTLSSFVFEQHTESIPSSMTYTFGSVGCLTILFDSIVALLLSLLVRYCFAACNARRCNSNGNNVGD